MQKSVLSELPLHSGFTAAAVDNASTVVVFSADDGDWAGVVVTAADASGDAVAAVAIVARAPAAAASEAVSASLHSTPLPSEAGTLADDGIATD